MDIYQKLKNRSILLVDDNRWIRGAMRFHFDGHGCRMTAVETGEEALQVLDEESFDIIIVDYRLPGIDGLRFLEQIRDSHPDVLKVLITAYGSDKLYSEASDLGVKECIEKPLTVNGLEECLGRLVA